MKHFLRPLCVIYISFLLCSCSLIGGAEKTVNCPGTSPSQQESLQILAKGCEIKDICSATMGEFVTCWRKEKVTIEDAKAALDALKHSLTSRFVQTYREGDDVWHYISPEETWKAGVGSEGYAIFRNGKLAGAVQTRIR